MTRFPLVPAVPFDARHTLAAVADFVGSPVTREVSRTARGGRLRQGWRLAPGSGSCVASVDMEGPADRPSLAVTFDAELSGSQQGALRRAITRSLHLELDPSPLEAVDDPAFAPVLAALRGYHPPRFPSAFDATCWALIRQRTPRAYAARSAQRLVELLGERVPPTTEGFRIFPEPTALGDDARPALLAATNNTRKVDRLVGAARAFATVDPAWLERAPYEEAYRWLLTVPGVGPWTAEFVLWRGSGRFERVPWTDTGALEAISRVYTAGFRIARGSARELAERYGWLQGLWLHYLKRYVYTLGLA